MSIFAGPSSYDPTGGEISEAMRAYQTQLGAMDRRTLNGLARTYRELQPDFQSAITDLNRQIRAARATGVEPSASWLLQRDRYRALEQQVQASIARLTIATGEYADDAGMAALQAQNDFFSRLSTGQAAYGGVGDLTTWSRLPERSLVTFMGQSAGSPLMAQFASEAGRDAMRVMRTTLASHIAAGRPARVTARIMADKVAGVSLTRAMTITRTETARARRAAALATFQNNPMVRGWVWRAALDRSCPACIALHGKEFPTNEMQAGHPNCRCVMVPMRHRGVNPNVGTGGAWLATKTPAEWERILGPGRARWLTEQAAREMSLGGGKVSLIGALDNALGRMVQRVDNPRWGAMYRPTSLRSLTGRTAPPRLPGPAAAGSPTRVPIGQQFLDKGNTALNETAREFAKDHGLSAEAYKRALNEHVLAQLSRSVPQMRRSARSSAQIVQNGRFKSQFETGTSGGALSPSARGFAENRMFGYPKPANKYADTHAEWNAAFPGEQRPVYGYMQPDSGRDGAAWYGEIQWRFKKDRVQGRSTFTSGDSLGGDYMPGYLDGDDLSAAQAVATGARGSFRGTSDPLPGGTRNSTGWRVGDNGYTEVQYHGGLTLDDVSEVILPKRQQGLSEYDSLARLLAQQGIPFRWED